MTNINPKTPLTMTNINPKTPLLLTSMQMFRLRVLLTGLRSEVKYPKMRIMRGPKCATIARRELGLRGNPASLLAQLEELLDSYKDIEGEVSDTAITVTEAPANEVM